MVNLNLSKTREMYKLIVILENSTLGDTQWLFQVIITPIAMQYFRVQVTHWSSSNHLLLGSFTSFSPPFPHWLFFSSKSITYNKTVATILTSLWLPIHRLHRYLRRCAVRSSPTSLHHCNQNRQTTRCQTFLFK